MVFTYITIQGEGNMLNVKLVTFKGYIKPGWNYTFYTINTRLNLLYTCINILLLNSLFMFVFGSSCLCFYFNYCYMTHTLLLLPWENGSLFRKWLPKINKKIQVEPKEINSWKLNIFDICHFDWFWRFL